LSCLPSPRHPRPPLFPYTTLFRSPARRGTGWCCECPKCRFVFLVLAPWMHPERLVGIFGRNLLEERAQVEGFSELLAMGGHKPLDRKSTRLNSSHEWISYAVFCLK